MLSPFKYIFYRLGKAFIIAVLFKADVKAKMAYARIRYKDTSMFFSLTGQETIRAYNISSTQLRISDSKFIILQHQIGSIVKKKTRLFLSGRLFRLPYKIYETVFNLKKLVTFTHKK